MGTTSREDQRRSGRKPKRAVAAQNRRDLGVQPRTQSKRPHDTGKKRHHVVRTTEGQSLPPNNIQHHSRHEQATQNWYRCACCKKAGFECAVPPLPPRTCLEYIPLHEPKSASFSPLPRSLVLSISMFSGFMSRWKIPFRCM